MFPVEVQILDEALKPQSSWYQAFSQDVSKGGICISVNNLNIEKPLNFISQKTNLLLQVHSPITDRCFLAYAKVAWSKKIQDLPFQQYLTGVSFSKVDTKEIDRLLNYVRLKKFLWRTLQLLVVAIICYTIVLITYNVRLNTKNRILFNKYSQLLNKDLTLHQDYKKIKDQAGVLQDMLSVSRSQIDKLNASLDNLENIKNQKVSVLEKELSETKQMVGQSLQKDTHIKELERKIEELKATKDKDIVKLEADIKALKNKEAMLTNKLNEALAKESKIQEEYSTMETETGLLASRFKNQLYDWLKNHQVPRTGLIVSFEGDYNLKDMTFIYDEALAIITYTLFGDYERAKKGLDFFARQAERIDGLGFYNAYYSRRGEVAEYIAHAGPNLWLGIAILQYTDKTKDYTYISLAEQIAQWVDSLKDRDGGMVGGKGISWYSTEHNLDAFAFFNMLYKITKKEQYKDARDKILNWLNRYAYGNESIPVNRGKGDSTIATDTYAWSIAAIGPEMLKSLNMDPDGIIEFAVENCLVAVNFTNRAGKEITVSGFDFAKHENLGRGGVISCEWTAQMVMSFNIMAEYYASLDQLDKAKYYQNQVLKYLNELNKMIISSLSSFGQGGWCLPYASEENVDTGHGWRTPFGNKTGSVAATTYTIFAISKFNPLKFKSP
jgi:hypothetical protein